MLTAINIEGKRITPFSNEKGFCPLCKGEVVKAVGEIYTPHFRHKSLENCDFWSEGETEWHYGWKQKFPIDWQEVVIEKNGELHRADVKTSQGLILELQNSSISTKTIKIREEFYENMVWLVNAKNFKDNFKIRSIVTQKLRESNEGYLRSFDYDLNNKSSTINELEEILEEKNYRHTQISNEIDYLYRDLKNINDRKNDVKNVLKDYVKGNYISSMFYEFKAEEKQKIKELEQEILRLTESLEKGKKTVKFINSLPNCLVKEYSIWKVLDFEMINASNIRNCKVIFKDTSETFFPDIIDIQTEAQFQNYKRNSDKFILIMNLENRLIEEENQIKNIEKTIEENQKNIQSLSGSLFKQLEKLIFDKEKEIKSAIDNKIEIKEWLEDEIINLMNQVYNQTELENERQKEVSKQISKLYEEEQIRIKIQNKGLYSYYWKNKRKTWEYANKPVYLDFGDSIFLVLNDFKMKKISIEDFVKFIKGN